MSILHVFLLMQLVAGMSSWLFKRNTRRSFSYDVGTRRGLTNLYNQRVMKVERMKRPMSSSGKMNIPFIKHQGVRVTTENGKQYLIHKGPGFGKSSQTVVVDAKHMSKKWESMGSRNLKRKQTIGDLVKMGGKNYNVLLDNCIHAAKRMCKGKR